MSGSNLEQVCRGESDGIFLFCMPSPLGLAVFASGRGSNASAIYEVFRKKTALQLTLIVSNNPKAKVLQWAKKEGISTYICTQMDLREPSKLIEILEAHSVAFIALAGFLCHVPGALIKAYPRRILNIHPSLLPAYGGKGMFGLHVHEAVLRAKEQYTGITIHFVDENYDTGPILYQKRIKIQYENNPNPTALWLAEEVLKLEYQYYPHFIEKTMKLSANRATVTE